MTSLLGVPRWTPSLLKEWAVNEQVDWHLVNAEAQRPTVWTMRCSNRGQRDPAYYVYFYPSPTDVPNREGPMIEGSLEVSY